MCGIHYKLGNTGPVIFNMNFTEVGAYVTLPLPMSLTKQNPVPGVFPNAINSLQKGTGDLFGLQQGQSPLPDRMHGALCVRQWLGCGDSECHKLTTLGSVL